MCSYQYYSWKSIGIIVLPAVYPYDIDTSTALHRRRNVCCICNTSISHRYCFLSFPQACRVSILFPMSHFSPKLWAVSSFVSFHIDYGSTNSDPSFVYVFETFLIPENLGFQVFDGIIENGYLVPKFEKWNLVSFVALPCSSVCARVGSSCSLCCCGGREKRVREWCQVSQPNRECKQQQDRFLSSEANRNEQITDRSSLAACCSHLATWIVRSFAQTYFLVVHRWILTDVSLKSRNDRRSVSPSPQNERWNDFSDLSRWSLDQSEWCVWLSRDSDHPHKQWSYSILEGSSGSGQEVHLYSFYRWILDGWCRRKQGNCSLLEQGFFPSYKWI